MIRRISPPRPQWTSLVERQGYHWHTDETGPCWREDAYYECTPSEVAKLRQTAQECLALYQLAAARVVHEHWWSRVGIREVDVPFVRASWERADWSLAGRFDFLWDAHGQPKLLEFNADTALTLLETALIQRDWLQAVHPEAAQFNQLHESLVAAWRTSGLRHIHCAWRPRHPEIEGTVRYLARTVREAGLEATLTALHCLGWHRASSRFVDREGRPVECCWKLYPSEWMLREPFAQHLPQTHCQFVEPLWRLLFSSKGMLAILWELFPDHPALLPCYDSPAALAGDFVTKPLFGREGHNITIHAKGRILAETTGEFASQPCIHQQFVSSPRFHGAVAQLGIWMVRGEAVALGLRESQDLILSSHSPFVPHLITTT